MTWSWSHTQEAYQYCYEQVQKKPREWLEVVFAEWEAHTDPEDCVSFDEERYEEALKRAKDLPEDVLADYIWERMSEQADCTNGGWEAHACPYGCGPHLVPFSDEEEEETDDA